MLAEQTGDLAAGVVARVEAGSAADVQRWALRVLDAGTLEAVFAQAG